MKRDNGLKASLEGALDQIPVPESLFRFVEELPERFEKGEFEQRAEAAAPMRRQARFMPVLVKSASAAVIMAIVLSVGVKVSPAFAELVKGVPGIEIAVDWLRQIREQDGVQTAVNNGYTPIEPVTVQIDGTTITIGDMYLTDEELLFKSFIRSDEFDVTDERGAARFWIHPENMMAGGSTTSSSVVTATDGSGKPVLQETYKYLLQEGEAERFLAQGNELQLKVMKDTANEQSRTSKSEEVGQIAVPIQASKLLHNKVLEPMQTLPVGDPDMRALVVRKLTIQPTTMNVILKGSEGWLFDFPRDDASAPYLQDDKGKVYRYDPSGPGLLLEEGALQLPFASSVFFDPDVRSLTLHIGNMTVGEREPSGRAELILNGEFPQTIRFKGKNIVIEGADYRSEGFLHLKVKKDVPGQTVLKNVRFKVAEREDLTTFELEAYNTYVRQQAEYREAFHVSGFGIAEDQRNQSYLDVYIQAPKLERYTLTMARTNDTIAVDQDYPILLKR